MAGIQSMQSMPSMQASSAITLDIKPGEKRVRLRLNKALIRRVLEENNKLQSLDSRALSSVKPPRVTSLRKQVSPMQLMLSMCKYNIMCTNAEYYGCFLIQSLTMLKQIST